MRLYIDPGTGSMLFSLAIGLLSVIWFGARKLYMKVKYLTPGKAKTDTKTKVFPPAQLATGFSSEIKSWQLSAEVTLRLRKQFT